MTRLVGRGRTAEVYDHDDGQVLKLFHGFVDAASVEGEFAKARFARANRISTPAALSLVQRDDRLGIVYQKVAGRSLLDALKRRPLGMRGIARQMACLHRSVHAVEGAPELASQKQVLCDAIRQAAGLDARSKQTVIDYTMTLPDGQALCHGDFHPDNILVDAGLWVIDWMTGVRGHPACDVARTAMLLECADIPGDMPVLVRRLMGRMQAWLAHTYLREYLRPGGLSAAEVAQWRLPNDAARLAERLGPNERRVMLARIDAAMQAVR
ncbi:phosphotransferase family protein [Jeongeupia naejangsanensis]|uniref:Phosphotransferase n=1 Tax=Jeongeupia naejangsanensis TaxID=613195 RepID=A0ABS2BKG0_9NEIS|nr:phosphotransferase [Jeongeupia naejangsanensis]MBM3116103.1 phosphotransferase [Jeongeupia naejangsanensis]